MKIPLILRKQTVTQAALFIAAISFISKFFGFFREVLVANYFGATGVTDAFLVALIIPTYILALFAGGFGTLVVPFYLEKKSKSAEAARRFVNSALTVWGIIFIGLSILILIFAPAIVRIMAYGFKGERFELAVTLTRYLVIVGLFTVLNGIFTGLLQAEKQFFLPIFISFLGNIALVLSLYFFHGYLGIQSWTLGQLLFASIPFFCLFIFLYWRYKFFHNLSFNQIDWKEIRQFALLLTPLVVSGGLSILNQVVDKTIASSLDPGSIAALNFSARIWNIPLSLLAVPIATAIFPTFSELALNSSSRTEYESRLHQTLGIMLYLTIPSTFFLIFMAKPVVRLFFERGAFDEKATLITATVTQMYVIGLIGHAVSPILARVFYSFKNTATPLIISAICVGLNIILNIVLSRIMGAPGIALATSIVMLANIILFSLFLRKYLRPLSSRLFSESIRILFCSIPIGLTCYFFNPYLSGIPASTLHSFLTLAIRVAIVGLISLMPFLALNYCLKLDSFAFIKSYTISALSKLMRKQKCT